MVSLRKIMALDVMKDARVLAGAAGLDREVGSVSVMEIPKETPFIKKSELLISSMYSIYEDVEEQVKTVKMLHEVGASGLILSHVGIVMAAVDQKLVQACEEYDFPLILPPGDIAYFDLITPIMDMLLSRKNKELRQALKIHDIMAETVIDRQNPGKLLRSLQDVLKCPVCYYDSDIQPVYGRDSRSAGISLKDAAKIVKENLGTLMNKRDIYIPQENGGGRWLLTPVISNFKFYGVLAIKTYNNFNDLDWIAINQTKNFIAIVALNKINRNEFLQSQRKEFLTDLVSRIPANIKDCIQKGRELGYDVESFRMVLVAGAVDEGAEETVFEAIQKLNAGREKEYVVFQQGGHTVLLLCQDQEIEMKAWKLAKYIHNHLLHFNGADTVIGIGDYCEDFSSLYKSCQQAETVVFLAPMLVVKQGCMHYKDVEIYDAFLKNLDEDWGRQIVTKMFGPLIDYDRKNKASLMDTFIALIRGGGNVKTACGLLYIHRNTMLQRKKKIAGILGEDPFEEQNTSKYSLCVLLYCYLKEKGRV